MFTSPNLNVYIYCDTGFSQHGIQKKQCMPAFAFEKIYRVLDKARRTFKKMEAKGKHTQVLKLQTRSVGTTTPQMTTQHLRMCLVHLRLKLQVPMNVTVGLMTNACLKTSKNMTKMVTPYLKVGVFSTKVRPSDSRYRHWNC